MQKDRGERGLRRKLLCDTISLKIMAGKRPDSIVRLLQILIFLNRLRVN